jgi:signal transduction histidine kinase
MLAGLLGGLFLFLPMLVIRRSVAPAIVPFSLFYSAFAVIAVAVIAGRDSVWLNRAALLAASMGPAILFHFSLTFPRKRRIVEESPRVLVLPYAVCALFFPVAWLAMERRPLLWPAVVYLLIATALAGWLLLVLSCAFSVKESDSPVERTRARMLLWGAVLPALVGLVLAARVVDGAIATLAIFLALSIGMVPLPIGFAVSRYNLFDLGNDVRFWVGRAVFYLTGGLFLTAVFVGVVWLPGSARIVDDLPIVLMLSVAAVVALEPIRGRLLGWMEGLLVPQVERLRKWQGAYVREMAELREEHEVLRLLGETVEKALQPRGGCVFLASGDGWEPACPFGGEPPARLSLLKEALAALGDRNLVRVANSADGPIGPAVMGLIDGHVEVAAALRHDSELLSVVLLGSPRTGPSYTSLELDFLQVAAAHASMALRNARAASALLAAEREIAKGRTALALAHEVSKDVGLIRTLAKRMNGRPSDARRVSRDLAMVEDLSCELERRIRGFVRGATQAGDRPAGTILLGDVVSRAVRAAARSHGSGRVTESIEPSLRPVRVPANFERILLNLLDNALLASSGADAVHLYATREGRDVRVTIFDRGCGMTAAEREEAFELGYTTRGDSGGLGVGLAVSRDIAEGLGGALELEEGPSGGTTATVRVPAVGA